MKKVVIGALATFLFMLLLSSVALASGYQTGGFGTTPHSGYASTSTKCKVCHAVHVAAAGGQVLLSTTVANACNYCHITTATSTQHPYGDAEANYTTDYRWNHSSVAYTGNQTLGLDAGVTTTSCTRCHSVHGANAITIGTTNIAKKDPAGDGGTAASDENTFCADCHETGHYSVTYNGAPPAGDYSGYSHVMNSNAGADYSNPSASYSGVVAWANSNLCRNCHKEGTVTPKTYGTTPKSYPHTYVTVVGPPQQGAYQWLDATNYAGSATTPTPVDAPCLNCHRTGAATGVGYTF